MGQLSPCRKHHCQSTGLPLFRLSQVGMLLVPGSNILWAIRYYPRREHTHAHFSKKAHVMTSYKHALVLFSLFVFTFFLIMCTFYEKE